MVAINNSTIPPLSQNDTRQVFSMPVDLEHGGIRFAGCATIFLSFGASLTLYSLILPEGALLIVILAVITSMGLTYLMDKYLKGRWLSGRTLKADSAFIRLMKRNKTEIEINADKHASILRWSFKAKRNGRIKKGWHVVACAVEQDGIVLPIYTFMSPDNFENLADSSQFIALERPKKNDKNADSGRKMRLAGKQRRLHDAEQVRYMLGAEVPNDTFNAYLDHLQKHHSSWLTDA